MTGIVLGGCEPRTLISHMALYGLGAILESEAVRDVRLGWTTSANPTPTVTVPGLDGVTAAAVVGGHARWRDAEGSWMRSDVPLKEPPQGLMSPRLSRFSGKEQWEQVQDARREVLDALTEGHCWLDLRFLAALGEPCYWRSGRQGEPLQDDAASRFEMQPRNRGSEFVGSRLRKLAAAVARREPEKILAGLRGESVTDEIGSGKPDSRTATGLASPGPTDNALAWCALWGISQFPIAVQADRAATTSGHIGIGRREWFYVPMWNASWRPARLRSILASQRLRAAAFARLKQSGYTEADVTADRAWLTARGVTGVVRFPIHKFGSDNAPERRAMHGETVSVRGVP